MERRSRPNPISALRHRNFRFVWSSEVLHLWGLEMENLVLAWFILSDTGSPLQVGLIGATRFVGVLMAPLYGTIVDRFDRRKVQVFARSMSVVTASTLLFLVVTDAFVAWHAFVLVGINSMVGMLGIIVNQALSADTVPGEHLNNAMGLNRATIDFARITGSLLGGSLMSTLGLGPAYIGVVAFYAGSTIAAALLSKTASPKSQSNADNSSYMQQIVEGVKYVRRRNILAGLLFFAFLIEFTTFPLVNELMAVMGEQLFGTDENGVGIMRATASGGALVGALITGAYPGINNPSRLLLITVLMWHLLTIPLMLDMPFAAVLPLLFAWGLFAGASFVALMVGLLRMTHIQLRGRVMGLRVLAIYGLPLGLLMGGWLAEEFSVQTMIAVHSFTGLALTLGAAVVWPSLWRGEEPVELSRPLGQAE